MARKRSDPEKAKKPFPTALRKIMQEQNVSQTTLAGYLKKSPQAVSLYCMGESAPDLESLVKIAQFFDTSTDYLLGLTNDPSKKPAAADELGLSAALIDKLKRYSKYDIINTLLETMFDTSIFISISALTNNINKVKDITIPENIILDYDNFEMPVSEQERKELSIAAILMREIFNAHPEFYGLYQITTASEHFHIQIDDICDIFRYCIEKVTGYSDYITRKR